MIEFSEETLIFDFILFCASLLKKKQQGKGQRRAAAVHIVDAVILGGKDVRSKHYHER